MFTSEEIKLLKAYLIGTSIAVQDDMINKRRVKKAYKLIGKVEDRMNKFKRLENEQ